MPKEERNAIEEHEEVFGFLRQSHISEKNVARLRTLAASANSETAELAGIVLQVAAVRPYKRHRLKVLAKKRKDLLQKLRETGLIFAHHW